MSDYAFILASGSPRRKELLECIDARFIIIPTDVEECGDEVFNVGYPSRNGSVGELAAGVREMTDQKVDAKRPVHFVTHSMGEFLYGRC